MPDRPSSSASKHTGRLMRTKLPAYLRPKCHALLLDTGINGVATARESARAPHERARPICCRLTTTHFL